MIKVLALTMGEPSSIARELIEKVWHYFRTKKNRVFFVTAPYHYLPSDMSLSIKTYDELIDNFSSKIPFAPLEGSLGHIEYGQPSEKHAYFVKESIKEAVSFVRNKKAHAVVTLPIQKDVMPKKIFPFQGHTEYLAHLCQSTHPIMMLANRSLRTIPLTVHVPLMDIKNHISQDKFNITVKEAIYHLYHQEKIKHPRVFIAGLNPHAGESGKMGHEEQNFIKPWINQFIKNFQTAFPYTLSGPYPADSLFHKEKRTHYDLVVCWYHDQALIPVKTLDFFQSINQTIGLPIVRTSPDHGTGLDIVGQNKASPLSLIAAMNAAFKQSKGKLNHTW